MLIVLPLLLVFQNVIFGLSAPTEFNLNITVQCKRKFYWCYEINLMEEDVIQDDNVAKTRKCIDSQQDYANHIMHGWVDDDGWFDDFVEMYVEILHDCNREGKVRRIRHFLGQKELIRDKIYNLKETIDLEGKGDDIGSTLWK